MRKILLSVCLLLIGLAGVSARPVQDESEARRVAGDYFERQKTGQSVSDLFCSSEGSSTMFNVKSFTIQTVETDQFECRVRVRVEQTNRKGENITATWVVAVRTRADRSCISSIQETK